MTRACLDCGAPVAGERRWCPPCVHRRVATANTRRSIAASLALIDGLEFLLRSGESHQQILTRLGYSAEALARRLYRADRVDLARPFMRIAMRNRRARERAS